MKKKNDVKFIIYQALYIFVICVIAVKGASIDLAEVEIKKIIDPGWIYVDTSNKILIDKDERNKMIVFDSSQYLIVSKASYKPDLNNPPIQLAGNFSSQNQGNENTSKIPDTPPTAIENPNTLPPPVLGNLQLIQYHDNQITNKNGYPITIKGVTIPANSTKTVRIDGEQTVIVNSMGGSATIGTTPNKRPEVSFQRLTDMGANASIKQLQRTNGFRIKITDDYPEQLEVKVTGPVTFKKVDNSTYDITLNAFPSESAFNNFADNRTAPYQVGFSVIVTDRIAPHTINRQQAFIFGEW